MPFQPFHLTRWMRGSTLVSEPDTIPNDALRLAQNVRLDRTLGVPEVRPGWTRKTSEARTAAIDWLSKLVTLTTTYNYAQAAGFLWRYTDVIASDVNTWGSSVSLGVVTGGTPVTDANSPDGNGHLHKYMVNTTIAVKDDGTTTRSMGIAPPTGLGITAALATDLSTTIDGMNNAANWTGVNLDTGPADETTIKQEGTGSVTFSLVENAYGSIAQYFAVALNLDTLTGGDTLVKDDDYIAFWIRVARPENLTFLQVDVDVDADTVSLATAFVDNYYSLRLGSVQTISQGADQWTHVQIRKSSFARYGSATTTWSTVKAVRLGFQSNAHGHVLVYVDDLKLRGGVDMEGDIEYTYCYGSSVTDGRGNPPKDSDGIVLYTPKLTTDRQRVNVTLTNALQGGANHPGDSQIDQIKLFRRGGNFTTAVLVDTIADTASSPYLDDVSDTSLVLTSTLLETDNERPPTGTTRYPFGPDGVGAFYMIIDGFKLYRSKSYEDGENRVENWPALAFARVGDGSEKAIAGIADSTQVRVWTASRSYQIVGIGQDTFLPVPIEGTRGIVGHGALCAGDGLLFFVSQDGVYADVNGRQTKLTAAIDPFFQGRTVSGQLGWNTALTSLAHLFFLHEPTGSMLVMLYAEAGTAGLTNSLVIKPNLETGQLSECFFDRSALTRLTSGYLDSINLELLAGAADGHVYRIEDVATTSDAGTAIPWRLRTKSYDMDAPQRQKYVSSAEVEGQTTGQPVTVGFVYDRETLSEPLDIMTTTQETGLVFLAPLDPTAPHRDIAMEASGVTDQRVCITRMGWFVEQQPEARVFLDSGILNFDFVQQLKRFEWDISLPVGGTLTIYGDGVRIYQEAFLATAGRRSIPYALPPGLKGRVWRITLAAPTAFLVYRASGYFKQLGTDQNYQERPLIQGV